MRKFSTLCTCVFSFRVVRGRSGSFYKVKWPVCVLQLSGQHDQSMMTNLHFFSSTIQMSKWGHCKLKLTNNKSSQMVVFWGEGKPEYPEKTSRCREENQQNQPCREENQQTQPTHDAGSGNPTRTTLVGGECSHYCAIPAPQWKMRILSITWEVLEKWILKEIFFLAIYSWSLPFTNFAPNCLLSEKREQLFNFSADENCRKLSLM